MHPQAALIWLCTLLRTSLSSPLTLEPGLGSLQDEKATSPATGIMVSWLWGLVWGADTTVSVIDRTPVLSFDGRPAAFGANVDVLGYMIRVEDFSVPCDDTGGEIDDREDGPWWPGDGSEYGVREAAHPLGDEEWRQWPSQAREGCPRLCMRGNHEPQSSETWIALVMRGGCTFVDKVREVQRFGAKGVVVGGATAEQDRHGDGLVQMFSQGDASDITIPATYITHASYTKLSSLIAASNTSTWGLRTVSVGITTDPSGWEWYSPLLTFFILLFLPSSLTLFTLLIHRIRAARMARRERAPEDVVLNLPWRVWEGPETLWELEKTQHAEMTSGDDLHEEAGGSGKGEFARDSHSGKPANAAPEPRCQPSTSQPRDSEVDLDTELALESARKWYETQVECAICLEEFAKGDKVRVLPCHHIFHMEEVDDWLIRRKKLCPICKHDVTRPPSGPNPPFLSGSSEPDPSASATPSRLSSTTGDEDTEPTESTPLLQRHGLGEMSWRTL